MIFLGHSFRRVFGRKSGSFLFLFGSEGYKNEDFYNDKGAEGSVKKVYAYSSKFRKKLLTKMQKISVFWDVRSYIFQNRGGIPRLRFLR